MVQEQTIAMFGVLCIGCGVWCGLGNGSVKKGDEMKSWKVYEKMGGRWWQVSIERMDFRAASGLAIDLNAKTQSNRFCCNGGV